MRRPAATRPNLVIPMAKKPIIDRVRTELHGLFLTFCLVLATTALVAFIVQEIGLTRGSAVYLIPVLIAATQWGIVAALFASACSVVASAYLFFPPLYSFEIRDPQEIINLVLFIFAAIVVSQLAARLRQQLEVSRQREIDLRDLYAFSRRLAVAFDVTDIHSAIEDHLAAVLQRRVVLFGGASETVTSNNRHAKVAVPESVLAEIADVASGQHDGASGVTVALDNGDIWLVRTLSPKSREFGVIAINLGRASQEDADELRVRIDAVLADATATLERLDVAHAISEAHMRAQTDQLREALIGSVSHELRTPLASIMGAATVLSTAPALKNEKKLQALAHDVHDEAERLNNDIQNLLDATRINSGGIKPHIEWADLTDIVNAAVDRCRRRLTGRQLVLDLPRDLPLVKVDPILVQQALVQIFDNAVKYSEHGTQIALSTQIHEEWVVINVNDEGHGLTRKEQSRIWDRFTRGERHIATTSGSGLGLWIANAFIAANDGKMTALSDGPDLGTTVSIELPLTLVAVPNIESDADE